MPKFTKHRRDGAQGRVREWQTCAVIMPAARNGPSLVTASSPSKELWQTWWALAAWWSETFRERLGSERLLAAATETVEGLLFSPACLLETHSKDYSTSAIGIDGAHNVPAADRSAPPRRGEPVDGSHRWWPRQQFLGQAPRPVRIALDPQKQIDLVHVDARCERTELGLAPSLALRLFERWND